MAHERDLATGPDITEAANAALEAAGERWTALRASVFDTLLGARRPLSVYDIAEALTRRQGRRIVGNTIYRIIDLFVRANLVIRVESTNGYVLNPHPHCIRGCMILICEACGEVQHIDDDHVARTIRADAQQAGFNAKRGVIEIQGECRTCSSDSGRLPKLIPSSSQLKCDGGRRGAVTKRAPEMTETSADPGRVAKADHWLASLSAKVGQ